MLKCKEVSRLVTADLVGGLGFMKKLELRMHLLMCIHCRRYVEQIKAIGRGARRLLVGKSADSEQLKRMEKEIVDQCCGHDYGPDGSPR